ncbi:uncharacterized protein thw [Drosophila tropicalis]|uniref:uncharacterized protein thw n=1 Tax=Drosophila tropicalis TaxID=46794 RepID=UPI0035AB8179
MRWTQFSLLCAIIVLAFLGYTNAEGKYRTPARILAKQTGATQFEEERYETHTNCNEHKHHLKKRASDEDVDYEVYQGVVGRPGIDFPIYPRIPKTSFSCRSYGNGYFADMETDCQVFHICEEGRKISFLCPNGTIFQQSELTCDWWFKVNCLGSSGYYAESAEILNKQRVHRVRPSVPVQGFNIVGGGLNIKPKVAGQGRSGAPGGSGSRGKSDRRIDSTEDVVPSSVETVDFDDVSGEKQRKVLPVIDNNSNDQETQITAESSSFVSGSGKRRHGGASGGSGHNANSHDEGSGSVVKPLRSRNSQERIGLPRVESTERARNGQRGQQRYKELPNEESSKEKEREKEKEKDKLEFFEAHSSTRSTQHTTPRRLEPSKSTPFYTPTVPSVSKSKATEGKLNYIKGGQATTPNPNRFGASGSSFLLESLPKVKPTASASLDLDNTSFKPVVIGMRHHYDVASSGEFRKPTESREYLPTTAAPATSSGPTYLPKSGNAPRGNPGAAAGGDVLLFAPNPVKEESVYRNVQDMLKTMNLLKDQFEDVELNGQAAQPARAGLEIPPSSGPDALVSLAKYFAQEHNDTGNALKNAEKSEKNGLKTKLSVKPPTVAALPPLPTAKPSDTTAILTTSEQPPAISENADDIKHSLLRPQTVQKYSNLFGLKSPQGRDQGKADISEGLLSNQTQKADGAGNYQQFPQIGSTGSTIASLAEQPESRKIAQIFSNALTSYLDNPSNFRAELAAQARPTEPPQITPNFEVVTTTDSSLFSAGTAKYYLPTKSLPESTTPSSIAKEINHTFDSTTTAEPDFITSTTASSGNDITTNRGNELELELSAELSPPSPDSGEGDEFLQQQQTQSFIKSRNDLLKDAKPQKLITTHKPTENPWSLKSQTDFLDPLTINDGLMKEQRLTTSTTSTPFTYQSRHSQGPSTTASTPSRYEWEDIFRSYDIPRDALPSSSGLQRIANKLFGGLNEQEALHLRNVMAKAEHDRQVLSLLLLLIQTCDDHNGQALERSRKHLLNALIDIDSKVPKSSRQRLATTTTRIPVTTYRRGGDSFTTSTPGYITTTELPLVGSTTISPSGSFEETTKFEIHVQDIDDDSSLTTTSTVASPNSDRRALELLKSLYSLASKFSTRR